MRALAVLLLAAPAAALMVQHPPGLCITGRCERRAASVLPRRPSSRPGGGQVAGPAFGFEDGDDGLVQAEVAVHVARAAAHGEDVAAGAGGEEVPVLRHEVDGLRVETANCQALDPVSGLCDVEVPDGPLVDYIAVELNLKVNLAPVMSQVALYPLVHFDAPSNKQPCVALT